MHFWKSSPPSTKIKPLRAVCATHIGSRKNHEDNFLLDGGCLSEQQQAEMLQRHRVCVTSRENPRVRLYAVCDGMGGQRAGEVASRICVERLARIGPRLEGCQTLEQAVDSLQKELRNINNRICAGSAQDKNLRGMGSTVVLAVFVDRRAAVLSLGDSRAYLFDPNSAEEMRQLTKDHTEGQRMLDLGIMTRKELEEFPARKNLNRYLGNAAPGLQVQAEEFRVPQIQDGILLLCSDGVTDALQPRQIEAVLRNEQDLAVAASRLIQQATADAQSDNATIMLIPLKE